MSGPESDLARIVLGALVLKPGLLEGSDIGVGDFPAGRLRETFSAISDQWEIERPEKIDEILLSQKIGGNGSAAFISSLIDGRIKLDSETFRRRVHELRRGALRRRALIDTAVALRTEEKTGVVDPEEFERVRDTIKRLDDLGTSTPSAAESILGNLGDVQAEPVSWLWEPYFPLGKMIGLGGDPDAGKSWFALQVAACLSRGFTWPDGQKNSAPGSTVFLSGEDDPADTLRPRLDGMGADASKIYFLSRESLDLSSGETIAKLEAEIMKIGDVRLIVMDPAFDFSGGINPNAVEQSRAFLNPIQALTRRLAVSTLLIVHSRKGAVDKVIDWIGGSKSGWAGKFRALFGIERTADDLMRRVFFKIKSNLAPVEPPQLAFRIVHGRLEFESRPAEISISELLRPDLSEDGLQITEAAKFLRVVLAEGSLASDDVYKQAKEAGFSQRTIERAKPRAGAKSEKIGPQWRWTLGGLPNEKFKHAETR